MRFDELTVCAVAIDGELYLWAEKLHCECAKWDVWVLNIGQVL
jgi:hypothetical protein